MLEIKREVALVNASSKYTVPVQFSFICTALLAAGIITNQLNRNVYEALDP